MLIVSLVVLQIILFGGLILLLKGILTQNVVSATKHLDELNQDYLKKEEDLNKQLQEAQKKSQEIITQAQEEASNLRAKIMQEVEKEREKIISDSRNQSSAIIEQAEKSRQSLIGEMEDRINKDAVNKACELIQNALPAEFRQDVHRRWVDELIEDGFTQLERLKLPADTKEAKVSSAFSLNELQQKALAKKLKDLAGRDVLVKEEVDPKVVAGIIISIGSLVLDGSLKNKIKQATKLAKQADES